MHRLIQDAFLLAFDASAEVRGLILQNRYERVPATVNLEGFESVANVEQEGPAVSLPAQQDDDPRAGAREELAKSLKVSLNFMKGDVLRKIWLFQVPLQPSRALMTTVLHVTSQEWEESMTMDFWNRGSREWRPLMFHRGDFLRSHLQDCFVQMKTEQLWSLFYPSEALASVLLQMCMRPAAVVFQLIWIRTQTYPYKLFTLLEGGTEEALREVANDILSSPTCAMDSFTKDMLRRYPDTEALISQEFRAILEIIAGQLQCSTFTTERLHSKNLRRTKMRVAVRRADIQDIGLAHVGYCGPAFGNEIDMMAAQPSKRGRPKKGSLGKESLEDSTTAELVPKALKIAGGGGAFRAYLHHQIGGQRWTAPMMRDLAARYRALGEEERAKYREIGEAGRMQLTCSSETNVPKKQFSRSPPLMMGHVWPTPPFLQYTPTCALIAGVLASALQTKQEP